MIAVLLTHLASIWSPVLAAADGDGGPTWLLVLGPLGAGGTYFGVWRYYRNTHTSHSFEQETRIAAQPIVEHDAKVKEIKGTKKSRIDGGNHTNHRKRVQRFE